MPRVLLVGEAGPTQLGRHLSDAASELGVPWHLCDQRRAYEGGAVRRRVLWWLAGRRPARLAAFGREVVAAARREKPDIVLSTGISPVHSTSLRTLAGDGVQLVNFLTDDPWNPAHRAPWFLEALPHYHRVWSPREASIADLRRAGARRVDYLPFGYNPRTHYRQEPASEAERRAFDADVLLIGAADAERTALVTPLVRAGFRVALYGGYWQRYAVTRPYARGVIDAENMRKATGAARISLGLVRRANRDGHSMRTFEVPAMGGCLLAEQTADHERLFGPDGEAVRYFRTADDIVAQVRGLLDRPEERQRLAATAHTRITGGGHTYRDRLQTMIDGASL